MKLLSIAHSYAVTHNRRLAHEMARVGRGTWEVTAVGPRFFHGGRDLHPVSLSRSPDESCRVIAVAAHLTRRVHVFFYGRQLRTLLGEGWDLVHCWEEPYILAGGQVARWLPPRIPLVYRTAQNISKRYPWPFNWIESYSMRRAAGWICSGRLVAEVMQARSVYSRRPMRLIPLGVDLETFRPDPAVGAAVRRGLGWGREGPPVIGFLGRFTAEKGLPVLMRLLDNLKPAWRALFVGAGPLEPTLRAWARQHGNRVRVCTDVCHSVVPSYLNAMDVPSAPSQTSAHWREQFGRMLIEAFACGIPVVGSDSGEIPHVLGDAGAVVSEQDLGDWCRVLSDLLENPARRRELALRGLERARTRFDWPVVARQHLDFFQQICEGRPA